MMTFNQLIFLGYVGKDPNMLTSKEGKLLAYFSVACTDYLKQTQWVDVKVLNQYLAKIASDQVRKGSLILVQGSLKTETFNAKDGTKIQKIQVILGPYNSKLILFPNRSSDSIYEKIEMEDDSTPEKIKPEIEDNMFDLGDIPF